MAAVFTPLARTGSANFLGDEYVDAWGTQWFYWFVAHQFAVGESIARTNLLFFPWGKEIYLHTGGNVLDAVLAAPMRWVLGPVAGYNAWVVTVVAWNAFAMRSLARSLVRDEVAAALAGVFFAFNPFTLHELGDGRPTQALQAFLVLFILDWLRAETSRGAAIRAGVWLALAGLTYWYFAIFAGIVAGVVAILDLRKPGRWGAIARRALATGIACVLTLPFTLPMLSSSQVPGLLKVEDWTWTTWSPTTAEGMNIGVYVFDLFDRVSGFWALKSDGVLGFIPEDHNLFWCQIGLAVVGLMFAGRFRVAVGVIMMTALVIASGPTFEGYPNVPYLTMVWTFRVMRRLWWPSRALVMVEVGLAMASAFAFAAVRRHPRARVAMVVLLVPAWIAELSDASLRPMGTWPGAIPAGYKCLSETTEGAIIELPYAHTQAHLYYQTAHGRPIFGGMVEDNPLLAPPEQVTFREKNTFMALLLDAAAEDNLPQVYDEADRTLMHEMGYRYVLMDKHAYQLHSDDTPVIDAWKNGKMRVVRNTLLQLCGGPVFEDEDTVIFAPWGDAAPCPDREGARTK